MQLLVKSDNKTYFPSIKIPCPYHMCDGSGRFDEGEFDDVEEKECLCSIDRKESDMDNDS